MCLFREMVSFRLGAFDASVVAAFGGRRPGGAGHRGYDSRGYDSRRALLQHVVHALGERVGRDRAFPPRVRLLERDVLPEHRVQPLYPRRDAIAERGEEYDGVALKLLGGLRR